MGLIEIIGTHITFQQFWGRFGDFCEFVLSLFCKYVDFFIWIRHIDPCIFQERREELGEKMTKYLFLASYFSCTLFYEESIWNAQGAAFLDFSVEILRFFFRYEWLILADFFIEMGVNLKRPFSCRFFVIQNF